MLRMSSLAPLPSRSPSNRSLSNICVRQTIPVKSAQYRFALQFNSEFAAMKKEKLADPVYRRAYVSASVRRRLAIQIRDLRGERTQSEFADLIGKPQNVVSRLEDPAYGGISVRTLVEIANALGMGLKIEFIPLVAGEPE